LNFTICRERFFRRMQQHWHFTGRIYSFRR
jgi:hypothetical protein